MPAVRPILFSAPMIRALLDGRKTQTRRIIKPQPHPSNGLVNAAYCGHPNIWLPTGSFSKENGSREFRCPHGRPGDLLWARETYTCYRQTNIEYDEWEQVYGKKDRTYYRESYGITPVYKADEKSFPDKWEPGIHMPRWASRLTLEITNVRAQRLRDISVADAIDEGMTFPEGMAYGSDPQEAFSVLWRQINGDGSWAENPWVWALTFKVHKCNVDDLLSQKAA